MKLRKPPRQRFSAIHIIKAYESIYFHFESVFIYCNVDTFLFIGLYNSTRIYIRKTSFIRTQLYYIMHYLKGDGDYEGTKK